MKYVLVLIVVVLALMWLTRSRAPAARRDKPRATPPAGPQAMVACAHCGVHLPRSDAVAGADGLYCSEAHRLARGDAA